VPHTGLENLPLQLFLPPHFLHQQRHLHHIEFIIQLLNLLQILLLHLPSRIALLALITLLREQQLIDHNRMRVDFIPRELLDHPLRLVQTQKLGDAHADEGGHVRVLELRVHLPDRLPQILHLLHHVVEVLTAGKAAAGADDGVQHRAELGGELGDFRQGLFHDGGELQEAEGVACGRGVEYDGFVGEGFDLF